VVVSGADVEAVRPFNPVPIGDNTSPLSTGYLIDAAGEIAFPIIGKLKMAGLSRLAATEMIKEKLKPYINNPIVNIRVLNYKVTVLGDVKNPGTFTIPNERITLLEALGLAGDMLITGKRENVLVIREVEGKKTEMRIDLTSRQLYSSPAYYLHQNDVIYVEPNKTKINSAAMNASNVGIFIAILSMLTTVAVLLSR
jgi:polysaccharide export outer membrane protein